MRGIGWQFHAPCALKSGRQLVTAFCSPLQLCFLKLVHALQLPAESTSLTTSFTFLLDVSLYTGCQLLFIRWVCANSAMTTCPPWLHSHCREEFENVYNLVFIHTEQPCCCCIHRCFPLHLAVRTGCLGQMLASTLLLHQVLAEEVQPAC